MRRFVVFEVQQTETFAAWHAGLADDRARARIAQRIDRLGAGNKGDVRGLGDGLQELRVDYGPGYRLYLAQRGRVLIILLCGGDKRTQAADIRRAKHMIEDLKT